MITNTKTKDCDLPDYLFEKHFIDFETLKKLVKGKFKNSGDYRKNRQKHYPSNPNITYKNKGWKGYCDFLGKEEKYKKWPEFIELKKQIKGKFKNSRDYRKNRKENWPKHPQHIYENKGWKGWCDFLDRWPEIKELKKQIKGKFKNQIDYRKNRQKYWPCAPNKVYKNSGWKGWDDFLGKEPWRLYIRSELELSKLKKLVKGKFKSVKEYTANRQKNWPACPHKVYKNSGWKGYFDFLGK